MTYYHLRYNLYPPPGFPVEKEEWLSLSKKHNEQQIERTLVTKHHTKVTLIVFAVICKEEYELKIRESSANKSGEVMDTPATTPADWMLDDEARALKKLKDDSDSDDERYRNITKPPPLL